MSTFGNMTSRIGSELQRTDIDTQIHRAIETAVKHWGRERFYFNEAQSTWVTVASQQNYSESASTPSSKNIDLLQCTLNGSIWTLDEKTFQELRGKSTSTTATGDPKQWAFFNNNIWLYPVPPSASYSITQYYTREYTSLTACASNSASTPWMTPGVGEELIRQRAKGIVMIDVLHKSDAKQEAQHPALIVARCLSFPELHALAALRGETEQRISSGKLVPTVF